MRWADRILGGDIHSFERPTEIRAAGHPWAEVDDFALIIINGVATAHGRTYDPAAKLEVLRQIARCDGVTSIRDCITLRSLPYPHGGRDSVGDILPIGGRRTADSSLRRFRW